MVHFIVTQYMVSGLSQPSFFALTLIHYSYHTGYSFHKVSMFLIVMLLLDSLGDSLTRGYNAINHALLSWLSLMQACIIVIIREVHDSVYVLPQYNVPDAFRSIMSQIKDVRQAPFADCTDCQPSDHPLHGANSHRIFTT